MLFKHGIFTASHLWLQLKYTTMHTIIYSLLATTWCLIRLHGLNCHRVTHKRDKTRQSLSLSVLFQPLNTISLSRQLFGCVTSSLSPLPSLLSSYIPLVFQKSPSFWFESGCCRVIAFRMVKLKGSISELTQSDHKRNLTGIGAALHFGHFQNYIQTIQRFKMISHLKAYKFNWNLNLWMFIISTNTNNGHRKSKMNCIGGRRVGFRAVSFGVKKLLG